MKEHKNFVAFSLRSFENARIFRDAVERGDYSHDYGRHITDERGGVDYIVDRCLAFSSDADDCVRMEMPGLVLLEYFGQAYCLAQDLAGVWHSCWVDEEF